MTFHLHNKRRTHQTPTNKLTPTKLKKSSAKYPFLDFPGGSETFEIAAKFCYGVKIDLSSSNVVPLRCAGKYLEMTDEYSEDNLISKLKGFSPSRC
ncbi:hypothetical protein ACFX14_011256 [Malus domestica]